MEIDHVSITIPAPRAVLPDLPVEILKAFSEYAMDGTLRLQVFVNTDMEGYNLNGCFEYFHPNKRIGDECEGRLCDHPHQMHRPARIHWRAIGKLTTKLSTAGQHAAALQFNFRNQSHRNLLRPVRAHALHHDPSNDKKRIVPFPFQPAQFTAAIVSVEYGVRFPEPDAMLHQFPNLRKMVINSSITSEFEIPHETYDRLCSNAAQEKEICDFIVKHAFPCRRGSALAHYLKKSAMQLRAIIRLRRGPHSKPEPSSWTATMRRQIDLIKEQAPGPSAACDVLIDLRQMRLLDKTMYDSVISQNKMFLTLGYCPYMRFDMLCAVLIETTKRWD